MLKVRSMAMLLACLALACSSDGKAPPSTQVLVVIDSDLDSDLASIQVRVQDMAGGSEGSAHTFTLSEHGKLPVSLNIVPAAGKSSSSFRVVARGLDHEGKLLTETKAYGRFVDGKRVAMTLWLRAACRGVACADDETCSAEASSGTGACIGIPSPDTREIQTTGSPESDDAPALMPPTDRTPSADASHEDLRDASTSESGDGAADDPVDAAVVPRAENVPTLGAFSTLQQARSNGAQGGAPAYLLFDDGFELGETSCNGGGLCLTGSFAP